MGNKFQLSAKCFVNPDIAFDISFGYTFAENSPSISMLFEYHHTTRFENIFWYYGGGPALAANRFRNEIGMTVAFGGEIVTKEKFVNMFAEIQPTVLTPIGNFNFTPSIELTPSLIVSVGARYIFF